MKQKHARYWPVIALFAFTAVPAAAQDQTGQQTIPNAQAFLRTVLNANAGVMMAFNYIAPNGHVHYDYYADFDSVSGSDCHTTFTARVPPEVHSRNMYVSRDVDWRSVNTVHPDWSSITVVGGVTATDGTSVDLMLTIPDGLRDRVYNAFDFLRKACNTSQQYGF